MAVALFAVASLSFIWFMVRVTTGTITDMDLWLNFVATSTAVWGAVLLLVRDPTQRWAMILLGGVTLVGLLITVVLVSNLPG